MKRIVTNDPKIAEFVAKGIGWSIIDKHNATIGIEQDGELIGGVLYFDFNGSTRLNS